MKNNLVEEMKKHLPFCVYPNKGFFKGINKDEIKIQSNEELTVNEIYDAGDMGGIMCMTMINNEKEGLLTSLTHLKVRPSHPLWKKIEMYKKARKKYLKKNQ